MFYYLFVVTTCPALLAVQDFGDWCMINDTGDVLGVTSGSTSWLSNRWTAMIAICAPAVWKGIGWSMMIFLAALQGVRRTHSKRPRRRTAPGGGAGFPGGDLAGDLAGDGLRDRDARHRRVQRVHVGAADDVRVGRAGRPKCC